MPTASTVNFVSLVYCKDGFMPASAGHRTCHCPIELGMYTHADIIIALAGKNPRLLLYAVGGAVHVVADQGETDIQGHIAAFAKISLKEK